MTESKGGFLETPKPSLSARFFYAPIILLFTLACQANNASSPQAVAPVGEKVLANPNNISMLVDHASLQMQQNQYQEIELSAAGQNLTQLQWFVDEDEFLPPGLEVQTLDSNRAVLRGYPQFAGTWCFKLNARDEASGSQVREELCVNAKEDTAYPLKFKTQSPLSSAQVNKYYSQPVDVQAQGVAKNSLQGQQVNTGIEPFQVQFQTSMNRFLIQGQSSSAGQKNLILRLWTQNDVNSSDFYEVYRQYKIDILDESGNQYACPAGYYYNDSLRYCVQGNGSSVCEAGTFYNPDSNTCVAYAAPPTFVTCNYNEVFDSYLGQCVMRTYPRCPLNYRWNQFEYRCDRLPYTCPIGTTYSYSTNSCLRIWQYTCGSNEYWDNYAGRCRPAVGYCSIGWYWNSIYARCEVSSYYSRCHRDEVWNWGSSRCERHFVPRCQGYEDYDFNRRYCVRREIDRACGPRERWSPGDRRCAPWITPNPVRPPHRPDPIRPGPVRPGPVRPGPVRPEPVRPGPVRPSPGPVRPNPEPVRPGPVRPNPEPVRPRPEPVRPGPVRPSPEPVRPRPEPVRPGPVRPSPEPVRPRPEPVRPGPVRPSPEPVRPRPEPVRPGPVRPSPEPVRPRPEPVRPSPVRPSPEPVRPAPQPERPRVEPRPTPGPVRPGPVRPGPVRPSPERPPRFRP